jgi:SAM-dependent methyltransferase
MTLDMRYLEESRKVISLVKDPIVLKTDLWNEEAGVPLEGGIIGNIVAKEIYGVEVDGQRVAHAQAKVKGAKLTQGDIRYLHFEDGKFDVILDLSTIDHVCPEHLEMVIRGYSRVLKPRGYALIVAWCDELYAGSPGPGDTNAQYFFSVEILKGFISKEMDILEEEELLRKDDGKFLVRILAQKRPIEAQRGEA